MPLPRQRKPAPADNDSDLISPEEKHSAKLRRRLLLWLPIAILLAAGAWAAEPPVARLIKGWHSRRQAQQAMELIERNRWAEAQKKAESAYALRPDDSAAIRAIARFLARTNKSDALAFYRRLEDRNQLTLQDRRDFAASALSQGELTIASRQIDWLIKSARQNSGPKDWLLAAQLAALRGDDAGSLEFAQKVLSDSRATEQEQFVAALRLINTVDTSSQNVGWQRVQNLANSQTSTALDALVLLSRRLSSESRETSAIGSYTAEKIATALDRHHLATVQHHLLAIELRAGDNQAQRVSAINEAVTRFQNRGDKDLVTLAKWLQGKGEFDRVLEIVPAQKAEISRDLFECWLEAMASLNRWSKIKDALNSERFHLDPALQHMYLAVAETHLGETAGPANEWERALEAAAGNPNMSFTAGQYAQANNALDVADKAYEQAIASSPRIRPAYEARFALAESRGETAKAQAILSKMLQFWPDNSALRNEQNYLRLLLGATGNEAEVIEREAGAWAKVEPLNWKIRATLGLARLRLSHAAAALQAFAEAGPASEKTPPGALAVRAAVLAANGWKGEAKSDAQDLSGANLLPEERALIAPLLDDSKK